MFHSLAKVLAIGLLFLAAPLFADTWTDPATGTQWEYSLSNSGEATIGKASNAAGSLTIPSTINGHRVTAIGWGAFSGCTSLTSITIPESVTTIGDFSFSDCSNLRHAYLLNKTCKIAPNAFEGSPTKIVFGPPPEEPVPEEMSPSLFWVYVGVGILAVVGVVFLGIWWRKRKARARQ